MTQAEQYVYDNVVILAKEALQLCLRGEPYHALELLQRVQGNLKRLGGDLAIVRRESVKQDSSDEHFVSRTFCEARAWGWLELASGVLQLVRNRPGTSLVHFTRAWRIWRPWDMQAESSAEKYEARCERARAGLWLGEAWARFMSERAQHSASAVLRAALAELDRLQAQTILQETIAQQRLLPPAPPGSPTYREDGQIIPFVCSLLLT